MQRYLYVLITKETHILFNDQISIQLLPSSLDILLKAIQYFIKKSARKYFNINDQQRSFRILIDQSTINQLSQQIMSSLFLLHENTYNICKYQKSKSKKKYQRILKIV